VKSLDRRLKACELAHIRRLAAESGAPYHVSADELIEEATQFFRLRLPAQLAEVEAHTPMLRLHGFRDADLADVRETLIRHDRPIDSGHGARA
jgi:hypothetical protein